MTAGYGYLKYKDVDLYIEYEYSKYIPEVWTLSDGSPGYPSEGGDFEIGSIHVIDSKIEIITLFSDEQLLEIGQLYCEQQDVYNY